MNNKRTSSEGELELGKENELSFLLEKMKVRFYRQADGKIAFKNMEKYIRLERTWEVFEAMLKTLNRIDLEIIAREFQQAEQTKAGFFNNQDFLKKMKVKEIELVSGVDFKKSLTEQEWDYLAPQITALIERYGLDFEFDTDALWGSDDYNGKFLRELDTLVSIGGIFLNIELVKKKDYEKDE